MLRQFVPLGGGFCRVLQAFGVATDDRNLRVVQAEWQAGLGSVDTFLPPEATAEAGCLAGGGAAVGVFVGGTCD